MGQSGKLRRDLDGLFQSHRLVVHLVVSVFTCLVKVGQHRGNLNPAHTFENLHAFFLLFSTTSRMEPRMVELCFC